MVANKRCVILVACVDESGITTSSSLPYHLNVHVPCTTRSSYSDLRGSDTLLSHLPTRPLTTDNKGHTLQRGLITATTHQDMNSRYRTAAIMMAASYKAYQKAPTPDSAA